MNDLTRTAIDFVMCHGACAVGVATLETLAGGPPSCDLSYVHCQGKCERTAETQNQSPIRGSLFFWDRK